MLVLPLHQLISLEWTDFWFHFYFSPSLLWPMWKQKLHICISLYRVWNNPHAMVGMDQADITRSAAYPSFPSYPWLSHRHPQDLGKYPDDQLMWLLYHCSPGYNQNSGCRVDTGPQQRFQEKIKECSCLFCGCI